MTRCAARGILHSAYLHALPEAAMPDEIPVKNPTLSVPALGQVLRHPWGIPVLVMFILGGGGRQVMDGHFSTTHEELQVIREEVTQTTDALQSQLDALRIELERRYATQVEVAAIEEKVRTLELRVHRIYVTSGLDFPEE